MAYDHHEIDWRELLARHDASPDEDFPGWRDALELLDADSDAQAEAEAIDPLMMFRRLPEPEIDAGDIAAMKQAVASARRARAVEKVVADPLERQDGGLKIDSWRKLGDRQPAGWLAAAAVLVLAVGGLWSVHDNEPGGAEETAVLAAAQPVALAASAPVNALPLVEEIGTNPSEIMQVDTDDLSLVVVYAAQPNSQDSLSLPNDA